MTALAMVLTLGPAERFALGRKQVGSYFGLILKAKQSSGGKTAAGQDQQTGQFVSALFAGGSGTDGGALRSATEALVPTPGGAQESQRRQGGGGQKVGHTVVPDVARELDVCATLSGRHAGEPESLLWPASNQPSA